MPTRNFLLSLLMSTVATATAGAQAGPKLPPALPLAPLAFPAFAERVLKSGAQVIVVENHEQPVVSVSIQIRGAGTTSDSDDRPGVAAMTATLLEAGTTTRSAKQIAETVEGMGANLSTSAQDDWATISATMLKSDVDAVLDVVADILLNPTFPSDEIETERKRSLTDLQVALSRPATLAQRQFQRSVFGRHPYGRLVTTGALRAITREDLVAFHRTFYKPSNALIVVAGDVNPASVTASLDQHLAAWTGTGPARPRFPAAPAATGREIIIVNKPGAVQAAFRIGHTIVPATSPDWPALTVANHILGGGTKGWLFENLREKKGYTYGAYSAAVQRLDPGFFQMQGDVRNQVADSAMDMFLALANQLRDRPVPQENLDLAKAWITGGFPLTIETPQQVAQQVARSRLLGQAKDHVQTWRQRIAAVTAADVQRVARQYFHPDRAVIVVSGDANILRPKLERFGTIRIVDEEGQPVTLETPAPAPTGLTATGIQPVTMTYTVNAQGMQVAEVTRTVTRDTAGARDVVTSKTATTGMMTGASEVKFDAKSFAPISSSMQQAMGGRELSVMLTVANGKISGMINPPQGDPQMVDVAYTEGTLLPGMDEFAIWTADFDKSKELKLASFSPQSGSVVPLTLKVTGESRQKVAAGEFDVYELEMTTAQGGMKVYARKTAPHFVVKQEFLTQPVVIELKSIR